jgi:hypothetical protein
MDPKALLHAIRRAGGASRREEWEVDEPDSRKGGLFYFPDKGGSPHFTERGERWGVRKRAGAGLFE